MRVTHQQGFQCDTELLKTKLFSIELRKEKCYNNYYLLSISYMPGIIQSSLHSFSVNSHKN